MSLFFALWVFMADATYYGLSCYAGAHPRFPLERFFRQYGDQKHAAIALLYGTFGTRIDKPLSMFLERFPAGLVEIHLANGPGRRVGNLGAGEWARRYNPGHLNRALMDSRPGVLVSYRRRVKRVRALVQPLLTTKTKLVISPELETDLSTLALDKLIRIIRREWPEAIVVASRNCLTSPSRDCWIERHGADGHPADIHNLDGVSVDCDDGEEFYSRIGPMTAAAWLKRCEGSHACFLWSATQQGLGQFRSLYDYQRYPPRTREFRVTDKAIGVFRGLLGDR